MIFSFLSPLISEMMFLETNEAIWSSATKNNAGAPSTVGSLPNVAPQSASDTAVNVTLNFVASVF